MNSALDALIAAEQLPPAYAMIVERWWRPLAQQIAGWRAEAGRPLIVGINGAQGSGKSTVCRFLEAALLPEVGLSAVTVSLDDLYLTRPERLRLAREVHPLLGTRGVPGTHDARLGMSVIDHLAAGHDTLVPHFSKALDDRLPQAEWSRHHGAVDIVLFEGWCVGATPQTPQALAAPINALERECDGDGVWRRHVNDALGGAYAEWFARIDRLVMLLPPTFGCVVRNRLLQEHKLRARAPDAAKVMDDAEVRRFVSHYERLTRSMFVALPERADVVFALDEAQDVVSMRQNRRTRATSQA
ncbi:kinase [Sphingomonas sp. RB3P16]|uniref:kinase n=1 Tax=Parasphingomonas frigoris TaxID=3096163 RepID=UPI002FC67FDB